eukprot:scaffold109670_cov15-Tisochrysis_lutea.AAC.1
MTILHGTAGGCAPGHIYVLCGAAGGCAQGIVMHATCQEGRAAGCAQGIVMHATCQEGRAAAAIQVAAQLLCLWRPTHISGGLGGAGSMHLRQQTSPCCRCAAAQGWGGEGRGNSGLRQRAALGVAPAVLSPIPKPGAPLALMLDPLLGNRGSRWEGLSLAASSNLKNRVPAELLLPSLEGVPGLLLMPCMRE